jgi:hypothetical protein
MFPEESIATAIAFVRPGAFGVSRYPNNAEFPDTATIGPERRGKFVVIPGGLIAIGGERYAAATASREINPTANARIALANSPT